MNLLTIFIIKSIELMAMGVSWKCINIKKQ